MTRRHVDTTTFACIIGAFPPDIDRDARSVGFAGVAALLRALRREWWYRGAADRPGA